jgi:spermidine/putrescine-binding protein
MLEDQAVICLCSDARMLQAQKQDSDVRVSYGDGLRTVIFWAIPEGAPHPNAALAFLRSTLDAQRQADFTETIGYSGVVEASYDLLPADLKSQVLVNPENFAETWSFTAEQDAWLAEHASEASDKYATWTGQ